MKQYKYSLLVAVIVAWVSLRTIDLDSNLDLMYFPHIDKVIHIVLYVFLTGTCTWESRHIIHKWQKYLVCMLLPILYGGLMEILQEYYFPPRTGDWADFACNIVGVLVGYVAITCVLKHLKNKPWKTNSSIK